VVSFHNTTQHHNPGDLDFKHCYSYYAWEKWEMHIVFWSENLKGRDHLEELGIQDNI
jgi:hypothetical protein